MEKSAVFRHDVAALYGKNFYYSRRRAEGDFNVIKPHAHEHYEIYYLTEGDRRYFIKNKIYMVNAGDVVLIKPHQLHYTAAAGAARHERILLNFTEEYVSPQIKPHLMGLCERECISIPSDKRRQTEEIFAKMADEYQNGDKYARFAQSALLTELLITILRTGTEFGAEGAATGNAENAIAGLLEYLGEHLAREISLEEAAAVAGFSKSHFSKLFKEMTGFTFGNYLQLQRLLKARRLLEKTRDSVTDIAYECGFMNSGYFSTVFKHYFGMTPLHYRKNK